MLEDLSAAGAALFSKFKSLQAENADLRARLREREARVEQLEHVLATRAAEVLVMRARARDWDQATREPPGPEGRASGCGAEGAAQPSQPGHLPSLASRSRGGAAAAPPPQGPAAEEAFRAQLAKAGINLEAPLCGHAHKPKMIRKRTVDQLCLETRQRKSRLTIEDGKVMRYVELVTIHLLAKIGGQQCCLMENYQVDVASGEQCLVMLPLGRKIRQGESWRSVVRNTIADKLGLPLGWQEAHLWVDESTYKSHETQEVSYEGSKLQSILKVHEVEVHVNGQAGSSAEGPGRGGAPPPHAAGMFEGDEFATREVCADGRLKIHGWSWRCFHSDKQKAMIKAFERYLESHGVDVGRFAADSYRTIPELYAETHELGLSTLIEGPAEARRAEGPHGGDAWGTPAPGGKRLLRVVKLLCVKLTTSRHMLTSVEQRFEDGHLKNVNHPLRLKLHTDEGWREGLPRAFASRLGLSQATQDACFQLEDGPEEYSERVEWSTGYPLRTLYKVWTVAMRVRNPGFPGLEAIGLPEGCDFITEDHAAGAPGGGAGGKSPGRLLTWAWVPLQEEERSCFSGTSYEEMIRGLRDAENLVCQASQTSQARGSGLEATLQQARRKIHTCLAKVADIDTVMGEVDVAGMVAGEQDQSKATWLIHFISANYTRGSNGAAAALEERRSLSKQRHSSRQGSKHRASAAGETPNSPDLLGFAGLRERWFKWDVDIWSMHEETGQRALQCCGEVALIPLCDGALRCRVDVMRDFLDCVADFYNEIPYHNAVHAAQTCRSTSLLSTACGLSKYQSRLERAGLTIAALCHDVKHFGRSANFCIMTEHELALLYNDHSALENMHAATTCKLMQDTGGGRGLLRDLERKDRATLRLHIIEYILSTDMTEHFEFISRLRVRKERVDFAMGQNESDRRLAGKLCIKAGDLSHASIPWQSHQQWASRITQEFIEEGDECLQLGLPVSELCDRKLLARLGNTQQGFLEFVCLPLFLELNFEAGAEQKAVHRSCQSGPASAAASTQVPLPPVGTKAPAAPRRRSYLHEAELGVVDIQHCVHEIRANAMRWVERVDAVDRVAKEVSALVPSPRAAG